MITALSTPSAGRLLPDANNTVITVQSDNGEGHYFRAQLYINGELFDEQGWSRIDAYTASKDLKKLYSAYFAPVFTPTFSNTFQAQEHLVKEVQVIVREYNINTGEETGSLELPTFSILHTIKPATFDDSVKLQLLGVVAPVLVVPADGKIVLPFFCNRNGEPVKILFTTDGGTNIFNYTSPSPSSIGKFVYLFRRDLTAFDIPYNVLWLTVTITLGDATVTQRYRINRLPSFPIKQLAFLDNFGSYQLAYPDGEMETQSGLDVETYETAGGSEKVYEINEEETYTINTGSYLSKEKAVIPMVATSPDVKLWDGSAWLDIVAATKKLLTFRDRKHQYADALQFTRRKGNNIANTGFITIEGVQDDIEITGIDITGTTVTINFELHNGYAPGALMIQIRNSPAGSWYQNTGSAVSPRTFTYSAGNYQVRLRDTGNPALASDIHDITID